MTIDAIRPTDSRPAALAAELRVALDRTVRRMRRERSADALTAGQFAVLATLDAVGKLTPRQLADRERVQPPSMTRTLHTLEAMGFVEKEPHPSDRRQVLITITEQGREEVYETRRRHDAWLATQLATITPEERETIADAIAILRAMSE